ncbi:MAG: hypothetical protein JSV51_04540 [Candidatus Bathyarchaeota archaeon]|nr:MAG: hypothetical protein JSV51_04540 [Candidatus Bathyarchaeota archaeon]
MTKPWQTTEWKKRRKEFLKGKTCALCDSNENLAIHHTKHFDSLKEYRKTVTQFMHSYFANGKNESEKRQLYIKAGRNSKPRYYYSCPNCGYRVYARKTIVPKYKCSKCGSVTDSPIKKKKISTKYSRRRNFRRLFFKTHGEEIDEIFAKRKQQAYENYLDFKGVEVLCKRCHFAKEKGLILCRICNQGYHKSKYGKCWNCFKNTDGGKAYMKRNKLKVFNRL